MNTNLFVKFSKGRKEYTIICRSLDIGKGHVVFYFSHDCTFINGAKITRVSTTSLNCFADSDVQSLFSLTAVIN